MILKFSPNVLRRTLGKVHSEVKTRSRALENLSMQTFKYLKTAIEPRKENQKMPPLLVLEDLLLTSTMIQKHINWSHHNKNAVRSPAGPGLSTGSLLSGCSDGMVSTPWVKCSKKEPAGRRLWGRSRTRPVQRGGSQPGSLLGGQRSR